MIGIIVKQICKTCIPGIKIVRGVCLLITIIFYHIDTSYAAGIETELFKEGINLIPYPQEVHLAGEDFVPGLNLSIIIDKDATQSDRFAAEDLSDNLRKVWNIGAQVSHVSTGISIILSRKKSSKKLKGHSYHLLAEKGNITIHAKSETGLFYGTRTLLQIIQMGDVGPFVKGMEITDWPDIPERAVHYDTKHFQEKKEYVKGFIRTLAYYKINMLIWEWEDKFAYPSRPEIGAPGAFSMEEMQELTRYAQKYHIQIVPLVQGLGHVSFILKHPKYKHLREVQASNWEFCPLREETYDLEFDLIQDAMEATPGSKYFHIGNDETYDLGKGVACGCKQRIEEIGAYALRQIYINRCASYVKKSGRIPMSWYGSYKVNEKVKPVKGLMTFGGVDLEDEEKGRELGYPYYIYDPNPGIEHLFLPYFFRLRGKIDWDKEAKTCLENTYDQLSPAALSGNYEGMISTSWNCSGVHNQIWMLRFIIAAEYSWSGKAPDLKEFEVKYFENYYGPNAEYVNELFLLLNKASYYYMDTFERKVWHFGGRGKTSLPDLPRDDVEYDIFWNKEYKEMIERSEVMIPQMDRVLEICKINLSHDIKNTYDFELFAGLAKLFRHTANTYLALSDLENAITAAHKAHFLDNKLAYTSLEQAANICDKNLAERDSVFNEIKLTWEKSQLERGLSSPEKKYVHGRDQQRNFANRRPDLSFMIYDEQLLGVEDYVHKLRAYMDWYERTYVDLN